MIDILRELWRDERGSFGPMGRRRGGHFWSAISNNNIPNDPYITEDALNYYITEDSSSIYVQES